MKNLKKLVTMVLAAVMIVMSLADPLSVKAEGEQYPYMKIKSLDPIHIDSPLYTEDPANDIGETFGLTITDENGGYLFFRTLNPDATMLDGKWFIVRVSMQDIIDIFVETVEVGGYVNLFIGNTILDSPAVSSTVTFDSYTGIASFIVTYADGRRELVCMEGEYADGLVSYVRENGIAGLTATNTVNDEPTAAEMDAIAMTIADAIAEIILEQTPDWTDIERIRLAAQIIADYCDAAVYTNKVSGYNRAYGPLCKGVYTCAGSTRALEMVLQCLGYDVKHINEGLNTHQWLTVYDMDGRTGWADGMGGIADYGACPFATGSPYTYNGITYLPLGGGR